MSYFQDDETTQIDDLNEKIENLQAQILNTPFSTSLENVESGANSQLGSNPSSRTAPKDSFSTDLGGISENTIIDFNNISSKNISANIIANTTIIFANIPPILTMAMRLYIRSANPIITIGGTIVSGDGSDPSITTAIGDFLDLSLESTDQSTISIKNVKKNNESAGGESTTNVGIINGNKVIDLAATSKDQLFGTLTGNSVITFINPDQVTNLNLELVIGTLITNLSVGGVTVDLSDLSVGKKAYLEVSTINGTTWDVIKKKLEDSKPSVVRNLNAIASKYGIEYDQDQLIITWLPSIEGENVKYNIELSLQSDFTTILQSKNNLDGLTYTFQNLSSNIRYYIRVKGVNEFGESEWYPSPPYYSIRTQKVITDVTDVNLRVTKTKKKIIIIFDEPINSPSSDTPRYTLIRKYTDVDNVDRSYTLFENKLFSDITEKDRTDSLGLISKDKYNYFLTVKYNRLLTVPYKLENVIVPDPSDPTPDDGTGEKIIFRLSSGGSGFIAQILLESGFDGIYWERSLQSDVDSEGHFTYRAADGFVYRPIFESDDTEILKNIDFVADPGQTFYIHYQLFNFPDHPNNYSSWSETKSLTISATAKPKIGRLHAVDINSTRIKLTIRSDNASTDNQQTLTIKRSTDGIDFTDIYTQLVSSTAEIIYYDDTVLYPQNYHYQAILSSPGGADVSNTTQETPTAPPDPTAPSVSYSLTDQDERRGVEYARVLVSITKTSPDSYEEYYEILVEPDNSDDATIITGSITNTGDTIQKITKQYNDDQDYYVEISVRAKRKLSGAYSSYTNRQYISIDA